MGPATDSIRRVIRELGLSKQKTTQAIGELTSRQDRQQVELAQQKSQIRSLQVALQGIVIHFEFDKLIGLNEDRAFLCHYSDDLYAEMKRLRAMGLVRNYDGTGLSSIRREYKDPNEQFDLKRFFYITPAGEEYLALRHDLQDD